MVNANIKGDVEAKRRSFFNPTWALGKTSEIILHPDEAKYKCKKMILMPRMEIKRNLIKI